MTLAPKSALDYLLLATMGVLAWRIWVLTKHENIIGDRYAAQCMLYGLDWEWAHPHEYGDNLLTSIPQPRNLRTGQIEWVPLLS